MSLCDEINSMADAVVCFDTFGHYMFFWLTAKRSGFAILLSPLVSLITRQDRLSPITGFASLDHLAPQSPKYPGPSIDNFFLARFLFCSNTQFVPDSSIFARAMVKCPRFTFSIEHFSSLR